MIKALICRFIEWVLSPFDWVDEDRDMGFVPDCEVYDEKD